MEHVKFALIFGITNTCLSCIRALNIQIHQTIRLPVENPNQITLSHVPECPPQDEGGAGSNSFNAETLDNSDYDSILLVANKIFKSLEGKVRRGRTP